MRTVYPQVGFTGQDVIDVIESKSRVFVDCYTITPISGDPIRIASHSDDVTVQTVDTAMLHTYKAGVVLIKGLMSESNVGMEVSEQDIEVSYDRSMSYQAHVTWPTAILQGRLDGATISKDRYYKQDWFSPFVGGVKVFRGLVSNVDSVGPLSARIKVKSDLVLLDTKMPKTLHLTGCQNVFGGPGCGISLAALAVVGAVGAGATRLVIPWASSDSGYTKGKVHIANGDSVVRVRTIVKADASSMTLAYPLDFDPAETLEFTAFPGCSRTTDPTTGCPRFYPADWQEHYRGFPFVPVAESAR